MSDQHVPVLKKEVVEYLQPQSGSVIVDATLGMGGHAEAVLEQLGNTGKLIGIDRDKHAIEIASDRLGEYKQQCVFIHGNYRGIRGLLRDAGYNHVDGILLDLGVSSVQLDTPERGFSFRFDAPLDMRMDDTSSLTAEEIVNNYSETELADIIYEYGEETRSRSIAEKIVTARQKGRITTTGELAEIIGGRRGKIHPATKTFQALRMAVNEELESLEAALPEMVAALNPGGRLVTITFHSLEDRLIKNFFKASEAEEKIHILTKKVVKPTWTEVRENRRARSAKLRAIEKL